MARFLFDTSSFFSSVFLVARFFLTSTAGSTILLDASVLCVSMASSILRLISSWILIDALRMNCSKSKQAAISSVKDDNSGVLSSHLTGHLVAPLPLVAPLV